MANQSGVSYKEFDMSQVVVASGNLPAAIVVASKKGIPLTRKLITSKQQFIDAFGYPDPSISYSSYCALAYLEKGTQLWVTRAIGTAAAYGTLVLQKKAADPQVVLTPYVYSDTANTFASNNPSFNFNTVISGSTSGENLVMFYPLGPGSFSSGISLELISTNLKPVVDATFTVTLSASGGMLTPASGAGGVCSYAVTAINSAGETVASAVKNATVTVANSSITLSWKEVYGASGYRIYGRTLSAGTLKLLAVTNSLSFTDTGSLVEDSSKTKPTVSSIVSTNDFTLNVYDTTLSSASPVESFNVTLTDSVDGLGNQTRIDYVVNNNSTYIRALNNVPLLATAPTVNSTDSTAFATGTSGNLIVEADILTAWNLYEDPEQVYVRLLINGGYSTAAVQKNLVRIAEARQDCIAFLDTPSTSQTASKAVDWRNTQLNVNTNRAAIFAQDLYISDIYTRQQFYCPPSGHMAALAVNAAYVTAPWYPMAGLNRGQLTVLKVREVYTSGERDMLKNAQINYVRDFPGQGIALFEQVTLQAKQSALSWISVRLLIDEIQLSVRKYLLNSVHELNDDFLRRQIVSGITDFLQDIVNRRGLRRFLVVCDDRNNSAQAYNTGMLYVDIYLDPTLPAEQIVLRGVITKSNQSFEELIGTF